MPTSVRKMDQLLVNGLGFERRAGRIENIRAGVCWGDKSFSTLISMAHVESATNCWRLWPNRWVSLRRN